MTDSEKRPFVGDMSLGSGLMVTRPIISDEEKQAVDKVLNFPEDSTLEEKAERLLLQLARSADPFTKKQQVYALLELDDSLFQEIVKKVREYGDAARSGMEKGLFTDDLDKASYIQTHSSLSNTPLFLAAAMLRRRFTQFGGYPESWDDEDLIDMPGFKDGDGLPRYTDGRKITFEEAVERKRAEVAYRFARQLHDQAANSEHTIPANPQNVFLRYLEYVMQLPRSPGNDIDLNDVLKAIQSFSTRFGGNQQIGDMCKNLVTVVEAILSHKDDKGRIEAEALPEAPQFSYPAFDRRRSSR